MGFGGSVAAMIASIKANNAQRANRKSNYKDSVKNGSVGYGKLIDHKKMSAPEFAAFKAKLIEKRKSETRRIWFLAGISIPAAIGLLYLLGYIIAG